MRINIDNLLKPLIGLSNIQSFPGGSDSKESTCSAGDVGSTTGSGIFPEGGSGNSLQYSCLGNHMGNGAWWATVHGVSKEPDT